MCWLSIKYALPSTTSTILFLFQPANIYVQLPEDFLFRHSFDYDTLRHLRTCYTNTWARLLLSYDQQSPVRFSTRCLLIRLQLSRSLCGGSAHVSRYPLFEAQHHTVVHRNQICWSHQFPLLQKFSCPCSHPFCVGFHRITAVNIRPKQLHKLVVPVRLVTRAGPSSVGFRSFTNRIGGVDERVLLQRPCKQPSHCGHRHRTFQLVTWGNCNTAFGCFSQFLLCQ
mmetsp:Transcript_27606/g.50676  ORF Transcript_27606/g.50676 Transcript_27606/m.50676 type:complete len:225 (-) Transcript_27606:1253-1927(-)